MSAQNSSNDLPAESVSLRPTRLIPYQDLWNYYQQNLESRLLAEGKALNVIANHLSSLNKWLELAPWLNHEGKIGSASMQDPVGDEFSATFDECLRDFLKALKAQGYKSLKDPKSHLKKLQKSWLSLLHSDGLPKDFAGALSFLMAETGKSMVSIERETGVDRRSLMGWSKNEYRPHYRSLNRVSILENYFKVQSGTLSARLPVRLCGSSASGKKNTPSRIHQSEMFDKKYKLKSLPPRLKKEFANLYRFYTDGVWVARQGLKRGGRGWRVDPEKGTCPTAKIMLSYIRSFMGYLCLPQDSPDPHLQGKGYKLEDLSLVLLADVDLVGDFIEFYRGRVHNQVYNSFTNNFLSFCKQLINPKTGYLTQHSQFSHMLPAFSKQMSGRELGSGDQI